MFYNKKWHNTCFNNICFMDDGVSNER